MSGGGGQLVAHSESVFTGPGRAGRRGGRIRCGPGWAGFCPAGFLPSLALFILVVEIAVQIGPSGIDQARDRRSELYQREDHPVSGSRVERAGGHVKQIKHIVQ